MFLSKKSLLLVLSIFFGLGSIVADKIMWLLGGWSLILMVIFGCLQFSFTLLVVLDGTRKKWIKILMVIFFLIAQWRFFEMIAMIVLWKINGFAP